MIASATQANIFCKSRDLDDWLAAYTGGWGSTKWRDQKHRNGLFAWGIVVGLFIHIVQQTQGLMQYTNRLDCLGANCIRDFELSTIILQRISLTKSSTTFDIYNFYKKGHSTLQSCTFMQRRIPMTSSTMRMSLGIPIWGRKWQPCESTFSIALQMKTAHLQKQKGKATAYIWPLQQVGTQGKPSGHFRHMTLDGARGVSVTSA